MRTSKIGLVLVTALALALMASNFSRVVAQTVEADDPSTIPPAGGINNTTIAEYGNASFVWVQTIGNAPGMDEYRWYDEDFCWTHSGFDPTSKVITSVTLEIRSWDVDNDGPGPEWEHDLIYGDTNYLGELTGASDVWSNTTFSVSTSLLLDGALDVCIDIDSTHTSDSWAVTIDWSRLTIVWEHLNPPVACFEVSNESPNVCETVTFNASCSYDPNGTIVKYEWDWDGDCTYDFDAGNNPIATHHYDTHGTYSPKLRVTDNDGLTNETSVTILVRGHPVADFNWDPPSPQVCETVTFDASASTPDGGVIVSWDWDFGDTTTDTGEIVTHHYDACGDYEVTLTVTDNETKSDTITKTIHVRAHPHADFTWDPPSPHVCETVTFDASASTPDCGVIVSWDWDFGDTTTDTGEIVTHHYDAAGDYEVTLTVTDDEGKSDTITKTITVEPPRGGFASPVGKLGLLAPYIGVASTILFATVATAIYAKRVKQKKENQ